MKNDTKLLHSAISKIIKNIRAENGISYTDFCLGNDIPLSTYDAIIKAENMYIVLML